MASDIGDHSGSLLTCVDPLVYLILKSFKFYLVFKSFYFQRTRWRLFTTIFDIYVFIKKTGHNEFFINIIDFSFTKVATCIWSPWFLSSWSSISSCSFGSKPPNSNFEFSAYWHCNEIWNGSSQGKGV